MLADAAAGMIRTARAVIRIMSRRMMYNVTVVTSASAGVHDDETAALNELPAISAGRIGERLLLLRVVDEPEQKPRVRGYSGD